MARHRRKLVLILFCLPILVTVITAFRLRDLPKKSNIDIEKEQKCDNCDVKNFKLEDQIQSARRSYEHLKKVVRGKQQEINKEKTESKQFYKVDKNDNDESEDEESNFIESHKKDHVIRFGKSSIELKSEIKLKSNKLFSLNIKDDRYENDDEEDDDDEDDNDDDESGGISDIKSKGRKSTLRVSKPLVSLEGKNVKRIKEKNNVFTSYSELNPEDDGYESDDEDDDKEDSNEIVDSEVLMKYSEEQISAEKVTQTANKNFKKHYYDGNNTKVLRKNISDHKDEDKSESDNDNEILYDENDRIFLTLSVKTNKHLDNSQNTLIDKNSDMKPIETPTVHFISVIVDEKHDNETVNSTSDYTIKMNHTILKQKNNSGDKKPESLDKSKKNISSKEKLVGVPKKTDKEVISVTDKKESPRDMKVETSSNLKSKSSDDVVRQGDELKPKKNKKSLQNEFSVKVENKYVSVNSEDQKKENEVVESSNLDSHKQIPIKIKDKEKFSKSKKIESEEIMSQSKFSKLTNASFRRNLHQSEFEDFYSFFPTFAPNFSHIHNPECRRHGQILLRQLRGTKLWALNMFDATAKIPSGVLQGNGIQFGDFDQCLGSRARVQLDSETVVRVQGKYCLVRLDLKAEHPDLEVPVNNIQGKNLIKSRIDDPGHFVPRFSTLSWGVCVPAACTAEDAEVVIRDALKHYHHVSGVAIKVKVREDDCHILNTDQWEKWTQLPTVLTLSFYGVIVLLVILATVQDLFSREETGDSRPKNEKENQIEDERKNMQDKEHQDRPVSDSYLSAFSLCRNLKKLVAPCNPEEISCIHGIRALATLALLVAHKFLTIAVSPYTNRIKLTETVSSPLWSWCRAGWVYTDCFLLLSGALTAYRVSADRNTAAPVRLLWRYLRLTPALLAVLLFYTYIWNNIGSGPMWGALVKKNVDICNESWWWNMLYIQNYFGFEEMCAPQTHQLALDMQLTVLGGILIWISEVKPKWSLAFFPAIHVMAAYFRYSTVRDHRLTLLAYHGVSVSQLYRTARLSYSSTLHRSSPYLIGISLGLALQKPPLQNKVLIFFGWLIGVFLWSSVWWAGFDSGSMQYQYNASFAAQYATLAPIASAVPIAWLIYTVHNKHSEILSRFLCSRFLVLISRLSYAIYLTQFVVYFTNAATIKTASEFTLLSSVDVKELSVILIVSVVLTLLFIIPMQTIHKIASTTVTKSNDLGIKDKDLNIKTDQVETQKKENFNKDVPYLHSRQKFLAHREFLEEVPESEIECEFKRKKNEELEEILEEEEEEELMEEQMQNYFEEEETEINEGGENMLWRDREEEQGQINGVEDERDLDEWEWTADENDHDRHEYYRYNR